MTELVPRKIEAASRMKKLMADHFRSVDQAAESPDQRVAWCTSVGPAELLDRKSVV